MEMLAADLSLAPDAESSILMCHCLASLSEIKPKLLVQSRDILQDQFSLVLQKEESGTDRDQGGFLVALAVLVLIEEKTSKQTFIEDKAVFLAECRPWVAYRIARQATRVGCHKTASKIFKNLTTQVASEHFYYWLGSLEVLSQAEAYLMELKTEIDPSNAAKLSRALQEYESGLAALRVASEHFYYWLGSLEVLSQAEAYLMELKTEIDPSNAAKLSRALQEYESGLAALRASAILDDG
eukprot:XP_011668829.1 PREDICTED: integrator complex subunit 7-like [Strongylocentrotus purpuratus]